VAFPIPEVAPVIKAVGVICTFCVKDNMFRMNSKTFLKILFVLKVGALEEAQSAA
jgi:hypothetical protein